MIDQADFQPKNYGPVFADLLDVDRLNELGPGTPNESYRSKLESMTPARAFAHAGLYDQEMAQACCSGVWLYHDFLEESHAISQKLHNATGSYWHGLMHRREGDYGNSKYWFERVGFHRNFAELHRAAAWLAEKSAGEAAADFLRTQGEWDPYRFIDLCASVIGTGAAPEHLCRKIQQVEWRLLFDDTYRLAARPV